LVPVKKPLLLVSNDWHLDNNNIDQVLTLVEKQILIAKELGVPIVVLGDVFDNRGTQRLSTLLAIHKIINLLEKNGVVMILIAGNHDKPVYKNEESWLNLYDFNSDYFRIVTDLFETTIGDVKISFLPFFEEEITLEKLFSAEGGDILFAHLELNGSTIHGVESEGKPISSEDLTKWNKVFLGHYHDKHDVRYWIHHLPSLYQRNFAENEDKGYTLIYDDLSFEHIQSEFKLFKTFKIDLNSDGPEVLKDVLKQAKNNDSNLRIEVLGTEEKVKAFKKDKFIEAGFDVKTKYKEIEFTDETTEDGAVLNKEDIQEAFTEWCEREGYNVEFGKKYLDKVLDKEI